MNDEDRLRARMQDRAGQVPDLADLDDVALRLGRRRPVRERRLLALVAVALVAGVGIGVVIGHRGDGAGHAVAVGSDGSAPTTITSTTIPTNVVTQPFVYCDGADFEGGAVDCHPLNTLPRQTLPQPGAEQPADPETARSRITKSYDEAYSGGFADQVRAAAIENGASLIPVFEELRAGRYGEQVRSAKTVVDGIVFTSPTEAAVKFHAELADGSISGPYLGDAVESENSLNGWLITQASYCQVASLAGVHCPA